MKKVWVILNGKIDIVIEMRKKDWIARAFGISFGQSFIGLINFKKSNELAKKVPIIEVKE